MVRKKQVRTNQLVPMIIVTTCESTITQAVIDCFPFVMDCFPLQTWHVRTERDALASASTNHWLTQLKCSFQVLFEACSTEKKYASLSQPPSQLFRMTCISIL